MKMDSIKSHLKPYLMTAKRKTTVNHMFAAAEAPYDSYDEVELRKALEMLEQDPEDLSCAYCGAPAETWDHIFGTVKNSVYSGYGHTIGNLLPCCKGCNSEKGNKNWTNFIQTKPDSTHREKLIKRYLDKYSSVSQDHESIKNLFPSEIKQLEDIKSEIIGLMVAGDKIAAKLRQKIRAKNEI